MGVGREMGGCGQCIKYSMFLANFIIFVSMPLQRNLGKLLLKTPAMLSLSQLTPGGCAQLGGAVVLGIGVWTLLDKTYITELTGTSMFMGAVYILIATGGLVTLIAFLGCVGAVKEVKCMLLTVSNSPIRCRQKI